MLLSCPEYYNCPGLLSLFCSGSIHELDSYIWPKANHGKGPKVLITSESHTKSYYPANAHGNLDPELEILWSRDVGAEREWGKSPGRAIHPDNYAKNSTDVKLLGRNNDRPH